MKGLFSHPAALFAALAAIPALLAFAISFKRLKAAYFPLIGQSVRGVSRAVVARAALFAVAWAFLCIALAGPRWGSSLVPERQQGTSVMFVMDVSRSMTVADVPPDRLTFASRYAALLVERLEDAACGVVLVKGSSALAVPLTQDHRSVTATLDSLSPSMLSSPGSSIGAGIKTALDAFPASSAASRTIVLFTDGDETSGSLSEAARAVRNSGSRLVIVGVGTGQGAELNVYPGSDEPRMQLTRLREDSLKQAARAAGKGSLYVNGLEPGSALRVLAATQPADGAHRRLVYSQKPVERYALFLSLAIVALCAGCLTGRFTWKREN
ncbi:MAG TPA: VWA domain-containing protein [Treponemataceae bacterium]|nr:VWA domain-containing protein [Treponemataceae bacterium]